MEHLKNLGGAMSQMHAILTDHKERLPVAIYDMQQLLSRMQVYFAQDGVRKALVSKLQLLPPNLDFEKLLEICQKLPGQQALHLDFVRGNVLFDGKQVSGVLDFEKAAYGHPVLDVARTLAFLLVDCKYKPELKIRKYFLESGYNKRGPQKLDVAQNILEELINFFLTHDFYKFLLHNPYESLPQNEHFVRTKALLVKRGQFIPQQ
jgi:Ser/Thr protein kinase RdoA (MazF antagonist)